MKTIRTVVGVDTAKRVFQLHWVDMETGEIVDLRLTRAKVPGALCQSGTVPGRDGGLRRLAALGAPAAGARPRGEASAGEDGPTLRGRQQERSPRRASDLDGGSAARCQDGCDQERGATGRSWRCTACASNW